MSVYFLLLLCFEEISELITNIVDPDRTPRIVASDPGLQCLPTGPFYETLGLNGLTGIVQIRPSSVLLCTGTNKSSSFDQSQIRVS